MYKTAASFYNQPSLEVDTLEVNLNKNRRRHDAGTRRIKRSLRKLRGLGN